MIKVHVCILAPAHGPGGRRWQTFLSSSLMGRQEGSSSVSRRGADPENDMPWWLSVTICVTIFNTMANDHEKYWRYPPTAINIQKKKLATVATNLSHVEHISTQVAEKHAVTVIKKCLNICTFSPQENQYPTVLQPIISLSAYCIKLL